MICPACEQVRLTLAERQGVEIDYCPECRGVWLDRGELDKLIGRAAGGDRDAPRPREHDDGDDRERPGRRGRRRESFLGDLFDFGG